MLVLPNGQRRPRVVADPSVAEGGAEILQHEQWLAARGLVGRRAGFTQAHQPVVCRLVVPVRQEHGDQAQAIELGPRRPPFEGSMSVSSWKSQPSKVSTSTALPVNFRSTDTASKSRGVL